MVTASNSVKTNKSSAWIWLGKSKTRQMIANDVNKNKIRWHRLNFIPYLNKYNQII